MKRWLFTLVFALTSLPVLAAPSVWLEPSLVRIGREAPAKTVPALDVYAANGEMESFQVAVRGPATNVRLVLPASPDLVLSAYVERYIYAKGSGSWASQTNKPGGPGWYADGLEPVNASLSVAEGRVQPFWTDVAVARIASAGRRTLPVQVVSDQGTVNLSVNLTVWDFVLPLKPALKSAFMAWGTRKLAQPDRLLLEHRLNPYLLDKSAEPTLMATLGLQSSHLGFFSETSTAINAPPSKTTLQAAIAAHPAGLYLYNYTADEITGKTAYYPRLKEWHRALSPLGVDQAITMVPATDLFDDGTGKPAVDVWILLPKQDQNSRALVDQALAKGCRAWSYNCLNQDDYSPKWLLDFAPINYRIQPGFTNFSRGLTGLLYWSVDKWTADPWTDAGTGQQGDGMLVYPWPKGSTTTTTPSIRLKWLRDGVDDYDYLMLLKAKDPAKAKLLSSSVALDWKTWTRDVNLLESTRRQIGDALSPPPPIDTLSLTAQASVPAVGLTATAGDSLGHAVSYSWDDGGAGGTFNSATLRQPDYLPPKGPKTITLTVRATCAGGKTATATIALNVPG